MFLPRPLLCVVAFLTLLAPRFVSAQIRADVTVAGGVTGTFTIDLEFARAPTTVASFIGLATGQRSWIDLTTGAIRQTPFYNGVTFHRVIAGFMSQTGSRNGVGTDGPGYSFRDEFDPTLRHDGAYVVSMANAGKHTNGSQIFITAAAQPGLDDKHSVFGRVIAGQAVVDAINATPVSGSVPVTPISIQSIAVYGASLAGFDLFPATLPSIVDAHPVLTKSGTTYTLAYDASTYSTYTGYRSSDLTTWSLFKSSYAPGTAPSGTDNVTPLATGTRHFFRLARIDYSGNANLFTPSSLASRSFTFTSNFPYQIIVIVNAAGTGGTWQMPGFDSGTLNTVIYNPGSYTSAMRFLFNPGTVITGSVDLRPTVEYTSANGGPFTATTNFVSYPNLAGSFSVTPGVNSPPRRYWGVSSNPALGAAGAQTLASSDAVAGTSLVFSASPANQYVYIVLTGTLTSIVVDGLESISDFNAPYNVTIDGQTYNVYRSTYSLDETLTFNCS